MNVNFVVSRFYLNKISKYVVEVWLDLSYEVLDYYYISSGWSLTSGDYLVHSYSYNDYRFWYLKSWERIWVVRLWHVCYVDLAITSPLYEIKIVLRLILLDHDWNICILHIFGVCGILHLMRQEWKLKICLSYRIWIIFHFNSIIG